VSNPLEDIIPVKRRKRVYAVLALIGSVITATFVGLAAASIAPPVWLVFISAFYGAIAGPSFAVANANARL
jgi:membrane protein DedA with SNARE-associated domain